MSTADADPPTSPDPRDGTSLSDQEIAAALGEFWAESYTEKTLGTAARQIFNITQQWPWELVAGFSPEVWGVAVVTELADTIDRLAKNSTTVNLHAQVRNLVEFLRERADERALQLNQSNPELQFRDVCTAKRHFGAKAIVLRAGQGGNKSGEEQKTSVPTASTLSMTTGSRKRPCESSDASQVMKSARRDGPTNLGGLALSRSAKTMIPAGGLIDLVEPVQGETLLSSSMLDMIATVENLKAASRAILNGLTHKLDNARSSMEEQETSLNIVLPDGATPRTLEELRRARDNMIAEKKEIEKAKALFEQHQDGMALDPSVISQVSKQHEAKLRECDRGIAQAEAKFQDMEDALTDNAPRRDKLQSQLDQDKAEVARLERQKEQSELEVDYYRTIEGLMKLGPRGLAALAKKLARSGISVPTMADNAESENQTLIDLTT
ncbi:hypothetical protein CEP54_011012 [Fusarium duplospermum]|uniref:Uncharacterized protein n=1 Tax=Fusarium duplospermum TaxID=1325734 RepID=A0A428PGN7_9HYPO|nr:hypothetical protein CEP54_011012 [Fusarium duplospermum]